MIVNKWTEKRKNRPYCFCLTLAACKESVKLAKTYLATLDRENEADDREFQAMEELMSAVASELTLTFPELTQVYRSWDHLFTEERIWIRRWLYPAGWQTP